MKNRLARIIISAVLFVLGIILKDKINIFWQSLLLLSYIIVGYDVIYKAFTNIFRGQLFDESFLMTIATFGAMFLSEYSEGVAVMLFYQIGEYFQDKAVDKSRKNIKELMDIEPEYANVKENAELIRKDPYEVKVGDEIVIKSGERVPLDAVIIDGESRLDTKALTGESVPQKVKVGDNILSGSINGSSPLTVRVINTYENSTVSKILDLVENASNRKSQSEKFITKFSRVYTPIVVIIGVIMAVFVPFTTGQDFKIWIYRAMSFLVISCPCALVISVPLSFFGGIGGASKRGILVKGSNYMEILARTNIIAFDKTGTLTEGVFDVKEIKPAGISEKELVKIIAHAESHSTHPIADSIMRYNKENGGKIERELIEKTEEIAGKGIKAKIEGKDVLVGNKKLMEEEKISLGEINSDNTLILCSVDGKYVGYIGIGDKIKEGTKESIAELEKIGVRKIVMLTGDREETAKIVAKEIGIDEYHYGLLPQDKLMISDELMAKRDKNSVFAYSGDGINDAPVLATADVGIAMGGVGSDSAIEAADIVLMKDDLKSIITAIKISKKTLFIAKENTYFAIGIKLLILLLTVLGKSTMWMAIFADVGVTIIAILNSFRTLYTSKL